MAMYSHSKISTFEQCPLKFKFRYIEKIVPDIEKSIELHLGNMVHRALEWLYIQVMNKKIPSIEDVIAYYSNQWEEHYLPDIVIVRKNLTEKDYFNKGVEFLVNYYLKHKPFDENTLEIEKRIVLDLDKDGEYKIQGFIDRLSYNLQTKEYEIHDYKTANNLPQQEKIDNDRQLALYSIAIKNLFGQDKEVCLIWHFLAHDKRICSKRTNEQLENLKKETIESIKKIESEKIFPYNKTRLCDWCEYRTICPAFSDCSGQKIS
ncbi:MAG TPA: PD-(D/E)XK nuclease family protein [Candidatus Pacearchaeota archaeon]|nr:PD-(D/E)XK nuclease superfamily protein [archaeon BMS3Abin17]HDK42377.1 PD-(D/E)XK nuclease family protein [Candidatus Pacearchaeota archaeon]HDZ60266.1 PD-(D/E)XK nuclease family protein [Candidatus Pacearchaeota archaeon]